MKTPGELIKCFHDDLKGKYDSNSQIAFTKLYSLNIQN